jgi:hypothetical protein
MATRKPVDVNAQICIALRDGPMATRDLAAALGLAHGTVYRRCCKLEEKGTLKSRLEVRDGPMYCLDERKAITRADYDHCREDDHDLRPMQKDVRVWELA